MSKVEIKLAEYAGFCFGVKRAVDTVYQQLETGDQIFTYGPIVHNEEVIRELNDKGVKIIETQEDLDSLAMKDNTSSPANGNKVIIRAHGLPRKTCEWLEEHEISYVDATCPFVKRIHKIVDEESRKGKHIIILGNPGHPEVLGIMGWCNGSVDVIETPEEAKDLVLPQGQEICIVAQTTFNYNKFQHIVEIFEKKGYNDSVVNTICSATRERQESAKALAEEADVMIVVGGKNSSNTRKLYEICSAECETTFFVQTLDDLSLNQFPETIRLVGITAGASTPNKLIEEVQNYVRINF